MKKIILAILVLVATVSGCGLVTTSLTKVDNKTTSEALEGKVIENMPKDIQLSGEEIVQEGPYGSLTITIPEGWSYKRCSVEDKKLFSADYGIQFFPKETLKGYIEVGYHSSFGVCGTGLETREKTLAGDRASVGYFDGNKIWDYVSFDGRNKGIVAMKNEVDGWNASYMEEAIEILDSVIYNPDDLAGAIGVYDAESEIQDLGLMVSVQAISPAGATLVFNQYDSSISTELSFGEDFKIEKKEGSSWREADIVLEGEYGYNDEAHIITIGGTAQYQYDWEWLYGLLDKGEYRIAVKVLNFRNTGDYDKYTAYAHFILR